MSSTRAPSSIGKRCVRCGAVHGPDEDCAAGTKAPARESGTDPGVPRFAPTDGADGSTASAGGGAGDTSSIAKYAYGDWSKDVQVSSDVQRALDKWREARAGTGDGKRKRQPNARRRQVTTDGRRSMPRGAVVEPLAVPSVPEPRRSGRHEDTVEVMAFELDAMLEAEAAKAPPKERAGRLLLGLFILVTALGIAYGLWTLA